MNHFQISVDKCFLLWNNHAIQSRDSGDLAEVRNTPDNIGPINMYCQPIVHLLFKIPHVNSPRKGSQVCRRLEKEDNKLPSNIETPAAPARLYRVGNTFITENAMASGFWNFAVQLNILSWNLSDLSRDAIARELGSRAGGSLFYRHVTSLRSGTSDNILKICPDLIKGLSWSTKNFSTSNHFILYLFNSVIRSTGLSLIFNSGKLMCWVL